MIVNIQITITLEYGEKKSRSKLALQIKFNLARNIITTVKQYQFQLIKEC